MRNNSSAISHGILANPLPTTSTSQYYQRSTSLELIASRRKNMTTECAQYPSIHCVFLRKEFFLRSSIFTELSLRLEDSDLLFGSFNKVDEIDMLLQDSSTASLKGLRSWVDFQDMAEFVPVVNIFLVRPIQTGKFHFHGDAELLPSGIPLRIVSFPLVCLAQTIEFGTR